jgi:DNA-binding MarR family transcriptional regulator
MTDASDLDAIVAALAQVRGRPRPPFGPPPWPEGTGRGHPGHGPHGHRGRGQAGGPGHEGHGPFGPHARFSGGPARLRLLEALAAASEPLSVSELGEAIGVDQPRASRLVQQAADRGLVRREADPDDARRTRIALTDEGARLARGYRGERRERLQAALSEFTPDERAELARLLTKLAAAWPGD